MQRCIKNISTFSSAKPADGDNDEEEEERATIQRDKQYAGKQDIFYFCLDENDEDKGKEKEH